MTLANSDLIKSQSYCSVCSGRSNCDDTPVQVWLTQGLDHIADGVAAIDEVLLRINHRPSTTEMNGMATTIVILAVCVAIGFGIAWWRLRIRMSKVEEELRETQQQAPPLDRAEMRDLLQEILDVASQLDGEVGRHAQQLTEVNDGLRSTLGEQPSPIVKLIQQLSDANVNLCGQLQSAQQDIRLKKRELTLFMNEARTDMLTGLKNRRSFEEELHRSFAQRQRQGSVFSLILIDIDHFKNVNDVHGHLSGDIVLRSVAQVVAATVREMDLVCRYGGDEFAVICPGSGLHEAAVAAERIRQAVAAKAQPLKEEVVQVTVSLGVAEVGLSEIANGLLQRVDEALYAAKQGGRNRIHLHNGQVCLPVGNC